MSAVAPPVIVPGWWRWLLVSFVVVVADLATKAWISSIFQPYESRPVTSFFNLVLTYNTGAAFSFLAGAGGWQRYLFIVLALGISGGIVWYLRREARDRWLALGLSLVLGGAIGNVYDRLTLGKVVDFLDFHWAGYHFPAFNVADSAITVGAALLILDSFRQRRRPVE